MAPPDGKPTAAFPYPLADVSKAKVVKNFLPNGQGREGQLALSVNDIVYVLEQHVSGWWGGHKEQDDVTGWFPAAYVRLLDDDPDEQCQCPAGMPSGPANRAVNKDYLLVELQRAHDTIRATHEWLIELQQANQSLENKVMRLEVESRRFENERSACKNREQDWQRQIQRMSQELRSKDDRIRSLEANVRHGCQTSPLVSARGMEPFVRMTSKESTVTSIVGEHGWSSRPTTAVASAAPSRDPVATTVIDSSSSSQSLWHVAAPSTMVASNAPMLAAVPLTSVAAMATSPVIALPPAGTHPSPASARCNGAQAPSVPMATTAVCPSSLPTQSTRPAPPPYSMTLTAGIPRAPSPAGRETPVRSRPPAHNPGPVRTLVSAFERKNNASPARHPLASSSTMPPPFGGNVGRMASSEPPSQCPSRSGSKASADARGQSVSRSGSKARAESRGHSATRSGSKAPAEPRGHCASRSGSQAPVVREESPAAGSRPAGSVSPARFAANPVVARTPCGGRGAASLQAPTSARGVSVKDKIQHFNRSGSWADGR